ncbi:MAG TPA: potassium transporter TrkG [Acidimicrobiales bacterium]|nr:potassium transporter TrkG [Acidimicrobiales bacterium]
MARPPVATARRRRGPTQFIVGGFLAAILTGATLLMLPVASTGEGSAPFLTALFTATSAVCVTGLIVVDTPVYWSNVGEVVLLVLIQLGGFGLMTVGSLVGLLLSRRIGLRQRMTAQAERGALVLGDVRDVLVRVAAFSFTFEVVAASIIAVRLWTTYDEPFGEAAYLGVFHAVSAFNNAGFALYSDSLIGFVTDWYVSLTVAAAVILGGIGFPVLMELKRNLRRPQRWSLHTKLTLTTTSALLVLGTLAMLVFEWSNPATLGPLSGPDSVLAGFFQAVMPRTAGFNSVDTGAMNETTWLATSVLMFIGGGSASTAGGIKVTTFALLAFVIWSETRGDPEVVLFGRSTPSTVQRQALSVALLGLGAAVLGTFVLTSVSDAGLSRSLFEAFSAFGTVGLSTGITPSLPAVGQATLIVLMFIGRVGPITLFAALVLRQRQRLYNLPLERPIIG